jgi:hypothetical protein
MDDILGFTAEKFRNQNQQMNKAFQSVQKTGKLPEGLMGAVTGIAPVAGTISPNNWKYMQPEAKAAINMLADKHPNFFQKFLEHPSDLIAHMLPFKEMPTALGSVRRVNPYLNQLSIRGGQTSPEKLMDTVMHELQHTMNPERLAAMPKEDASTIGMLLHSLLKGGGQGDKSLAARLGEFGQKMEAGPIDPATYFHDVDPKFWKSLTPEQKAVATTHIPEAIDNAASPAIFNKVFGYTKEEPYGDFLHRILGDEGFAHLSERTRFPRNAEMYPGTTLSAQEQASDKLYDLAQKLGVGEPQKTLQQELELARFPTEKGL